MAGSATSGSGRNRLSESTSPYLQQHKDNPVHWWEWGPDAFEEARRRDVPVLLSVGYSACHWCHVMAHESFEDDETAGYMNAHFVNVKVDREERPDVDAVYMEAVQAMTGHGGWPMTAFLTPTAEPFFCGTYWPKERRHGMPSFGEVLMSVVDAWQTRQGEVLDAGREVVARLSQPVAHQQGEVGADLLDRAAAALARSYDGVHGGFGSSPKFPPSMVLEFLLRRHARTGEGLEKVAHTCEAMARGGMYDQLAGGFARYSVDSAWVVPHFEKMLYDNALLLRVYTHWWRASGSPFARRVALETADFLLRDLGTAEGGFASALDADAAGVEGSTYVWTPEQLAEVLGPQDGAWAAELLEVTGTFEHGTSTLQLLLDPDDPVRWESVRTRLLAARSLRPQPGRDDKVVASWNGLAVAALAEPGLFQGVVAGARAYFAMVNSQGGVYGRTISTKVADSQVDCNATTNAYSSLLSSNVFAVVSSMSLYDNCAVPVLNQYPNVPDVSFAFDKDHSKRADTFQVQPFVPGARTGPYLTLAKAFPQIKDAVGVVYPDVAGARSAWSYYKAALQSIGFKVVYEQAAPATQVDYTQYVIGMRQAGVQMAMVIIDAAHDEDFVNAAQQQRWSPAVIEAPGPMYDPSFPQAVGTGITDVYNDLGFSLFLNADERRIPGVAAFQDWMKRTAPDQTINQFAVYGWAHAGLFVQALRDAGPRLTRAALVAALRKIHSFGADGLIFSGDPGSQGPQRCYLLAHYANGAWQRWNSPATGARCDGTYYLVKD